MPKRRFSGLLQAGLAAMLLALAGCRDASWIVAWRESGLALVCASGVLLALRVWQRRSPLWPLTLALCVAASVLSGSWLMRHAWQKQQLFDAPPALAQALGRHFIIGYTDESELRELIRRGLIGGVFVTRRNLQGHDAESLQRMIAGWQTLSRQHGFARLLIATDHEGGIVARMSPPLPSQPALGTLLSGSDAPARIAMDYGRQQGEGLARLGITLNLAPVVDLDHGVRNPDDRYSKISSRALASSPALVGTAAAAYCAGLAQRHVQCTFKHFPGLGPVYEDTHADGARITTPLATLLQHDLQPFRQLMRNGHSVTMLAHARLAAVDDSYPASSSPAVVQTLIRQQWGYNGVLMTDDLSMGAARDQAGGLDAAVRRALNAGVDILLVSWDPALYYPLMTALLADHGAGRLDPVALARSDARLRGDAAVQ
ncbi:hypothetical protein R0381_000872 [Jeongeupia wiesaeckerbachi]|uniref:glycoside hydrolase family 3 N-terminal domain-containing protein n=1 Tax=Jeongeupia wiesaeckerbachi TaxID=3051218 RepID=UPI003D80971D